MKKAITLTVALLSLSATLALAQSGVNFYVGDCSAGATTNAVTNACTSNVGSITLVGSCILATSMTDFIGAAAIVDVQTDQAVIPDWWRADGAGCRVGSITAAMDPTVSPSCLTIWDGQANILPVFAVLANDPSRVGNDVPVSRVRFNAGAALSAGGIALTADGTTELGVVKFTITKAKSVGTGACAGCTDGACLVLNEINLQHELPGAPFERITNPLTSNMVTYNAASLALACPSAVPVRNRTWGSIKSLYR